MPPGTTPPFIIRYSASERADPAARARERHAVASSSSSTTASTSSAPTSRRSRARRSRSRTAASSARSWSTSIRSGSTRGGSRRATSSTALGRQNVILPTGTAKIGANEYPIVISRSARDARRSSASCRSRPSTARTVYIRDVANVRDGYAPQTNMVHVEGRRSVLMAILKNGDASTLDVADADPRGASRARSSGCPRRRTASSRSSCCSISRCSCAPSIDGVVHEAVIAAGADRR